MISWKRKLAPKTNGGGRCILTRKERIAGSEKKAREKSGQRRQKWFISSVVKRFKGNAARGFRIDMTSQNWEQESFPPTVFLTISKEGKRSWIYLRNPSGRYYNARTIVSMFCFLLLRWTLYGVNGHPLMLFNVIERKLSLWIPVWPRTFLSGLRSDILCIIHLCYRISEGSGVVGVRKRFYGNGFSKIEYL